MADEAVVVDQLVVVEPQSQGPDIAALAAFAFQDQSPKNQPAAQATEPTVAVPATEPASNAAPVVSDDEAQALIKEIFGVEGGIEVVKQQWDELQALKANPPKAELTYANEEAKKWAEYFAAGKEDELYQSLHGRQQVKNVESLSDDQRLKLYIKLNNPLYDSELVDAVYEKNYTFNEAQFKDEEGKINDTLGYRLAKVDALQRMQQDIQKANDFFAQYKTKIELPVIQPTAQTTKDEAYEAYKASTAKAQEDYNNVTVPAINSITDKDVPLAFKVTDPNNQMDFDVNLAIEPADLAAAKQAALNLRGFLNDEFYDKDGKLKGNELVKMIALYKNFGKYAQSSARQAVNAERKRVITKEAPANPLQKNFPVVEEKDQLKELERYVFAGIK